MSSNRIYLDSESALETGCLETRAEGLGCCSCSRPDPVEVLAEVVHNHPAAAVLKAVHSGVAARQIADLAAGLP